MSWQRACVVCARHPHAPDEPCGDRCRVVALEAGHVCDRCRSRMTHDLRSIPEIVAIAETCPVPARGGTVGARTAGSRPPVALEALDAAQTLVRLEPTDPSSEVTILEALEGWERLIREERGLAAFGPASLIRTIANGDGYRPSSITLVGCTGFLIAQMPYICAEDTFDVTGFASLIDRILAVLRRWDPLSEQISGWKVPCPTLKDDGECGRILVIRSLESDPIWCRSCGRGWEPRRLAAVAGRDADVWADPEAISSWTGIPERTLRDWASRGRVKRDHGRYSLASVRDAAERQGRKDA